MSSEDKKVDGIKKISPERLEKSRKMILDIINEDEKKKNTILNDKLKKVDGLFTFTKKVEPPKIENNKIETEIKKDKTFNETKKTIIDADNANEFLKMEEQKRREAQLKIEEQLKREEQVKVDEQRKKKIEEIKNNNILEKAGIVKLDSISPNFVNNLPKTIEKKPTDISSKNQANKKYQEIKKETSKTEIEKLEKQKKEQAERQKKEEEKIMQKEKRRIEIEEQREQKEINAELRKRERKIKIKMWKDSFGQKVIYIKRSFKSSIRKVVYCIFLITLISVLLYSLFTILVIKFNLDNVVTRKVSKYFVFPAYLTKDGVVEYYYYKDMKNNLQNQNSNLLPEELDKHVKVEITKNLIINDLVQKYNLNDSSNDYSKNIAMAVIRDKRINQVGYLRISKIKEMINKNGDFVEIADKYGDSKDKINIKTNESSQYSYGEQIKNLKINEVSDIIFATDGYYIFRCYNKDENSIGLSYVKVNAKNLEQYVSEQIGSYKLYSLVD